MAETIAQVPSREYVMNSFENALLIGETPQSDRFYKAFINLLQGPPISISDINLKWEA